jgi:hypothetical protein
LKTSETLKKIIIKYGSDLKIFIKNKIRENMKHRKTKKLYKIKNKIYNKMLRNPSLYRCEKLKKRWKTCKPYNLPTAENLSRKQQPQIFNNMEILKRL